MNREEITLLGFEIVAFSVTLMHGQDHLMTTLLLRDMMGHMIELYKRGDKK